MTFFSLALNALQPAAIAAPASAAGEPVDAAFGTLPLDDCLALYQKKCQLREGETLEGMQDGDSKVGDDEPWTPEIKVKGGNSAFYSIGVGKGE